MRWADTLAELNAKSASLGDTGFVLSGSGAGIYERGASNFGTKVADLPLAFSYQNIDDTADIDKPVSTAQAAAIEVERLARIAGDDAVSEGLYFAGPWDASSGSFPTVRAQGGAVQNGDVFDVSVAGTVDGVVFAVAERVIALVDAPSSATYAGNWYKAQTIAALSPITARLDVVESGVATNAGDIVVLAGDIAGLSLNDIGALKDLSRRISGGETVYVTAYGDSSVLGTDGVTETYNNWPNRLGSILRTMTGNANIATYNAGSGGKKVIDDWAIDNLAASVTTPFPNTEYLMICFGLNDIKVDLPGWNQNLYRTKYSELIAAVRAAGIKPIMVTSNITAGADIRPNKLMQGELLAVQRQIALDNRVDLIDPNEMLLNWQNYGSGSQRLGDIQADGTHFNDEGNVAIAQYMSYVILKDRVGLATDGAMFGYDNASYSDNVSVDYDYDVSNHFGCAPIITATASEDAADIYVWAPRDMICSYASVDRGTTATGGEEVYVSHIGTTSTVGSVVAFGAAATSVLNKPSECMFKVATLKFGLNRLRYKTPAAGVYRMGYFITHDAAKPVTVAKYSVATEREIILPQIWGTSQAIASATGGTIDLTIEGSIPVGWGAVISSTYVYHSDGTDTGPSRRANSIVVYRSATAVELMSILHGANGVISATNIKTTGTGTWAGLMTAHIGLNGADYDIQVRSNGQIVARHTAVSGTDAEFYSAYGRIGGLYRNNVDATAVSSRQAVSTVMLGTE
uniref:SGNH/GDSL hydrolase family protein n=1 Tax=Yoonia sp. TaxID=2212373 RepID=UPI00404876D9